MSAVEQEHDVANARKPSSDTAGASRPKLPEQFADLSPRLEWVALDENERLQKRVASSIDEMREFYDLMFPRMPEIIEYLLGVDISDMSDEEETVLTLAVAYAEIADAVDFYAPDSTAPDGVGRFRAVHAGLRWQRSDALR
jgi:hypothetical protein